MNLKLEKMNDRRTFTAEIFEEKANSQIKLVENSTHMLHWDYPTVVVREIRKNWCI